MAGCCNPGDGLPGGTRVMRFYVVEKATNRDVPAEEGGGVWPSWHEARVRAEALGPGFKPDDRIELA